MGNKFTCDDGLCLGLERRCDHVFDCADGSDEDQCTPLEIDVESYKKTFPPFLRSHKTKVRVELKIFAISKIDELTNSFKADVKIALKWVDNRIIFNNLEKNGNILDRFWQDQIWLPPLYFSNTDEKVPILTGKHVQVEVLRQGEPEKIDVSRINEGNQYSGDKSELHLTARDVLFYNCVFELSWFPFDVQHCSIDIKIPKQLRNYTTLIPNRVEYKGK